MFWCLMEWNCQQTPSGSENQSNYQTWFDKQNKDFPFFSLQFPKHTLSDKKWLTWKSWNWFPCDAQRSASPSIHTARVAAAGCPRHGNLPHLQPTHICVLLLHFSILLFLEFLHRSPTGLCSTRASFSTLPTTIRQRMEGELRDQGGLTDISFPMPVWVRFGFMPLPICHMMASAGWLL